MEPEYGSGVGLGLGSEVTVLWKDGSSRTIFVPMSGTLQWLTLHMQTNIKDTAPYYNKNHRLDIDTHVSNITNDWGK